MALVVVLAIIVLVSAVGISFFAHVMANRKIEASRANRMKTDLLAQSAGNYVISQFMQEITGTAASSGTTVGTVTIYQPQTQADAVPKRTISPNISLSDTNYNNLIRQSVGQADVSADSSALASQNGRLLSTARWNAPVMLGGSGFTSTSQLPNWIYIHRLNGATATSSTEVIGRFAYNVYDNGGLLDANVAGYPGVTGNAVVAQLKATVAGADLTQLGIAQDAIDQLVSFRNATAALSGSSFSNWVSTSATSGFLFPIAGSGVSGTVADSVFLTRQDLLRYARTQNKGLAGALPYLTHFTRTVNAPSWGPAADAGTGFAYLSDANLASGTNRFLPNVRFLTAGTVNHYADDGSVSTYSVSVGDCLLQRRFSLAKLAWLTHDGPLSSNLKDAIQACFGLKWDSSGKQWQYVANTSTLQPSIKTLGDVAKELREPNFFELLQAGILRGSLGKCGYTAGSNRHGYSQGGITGYERNTTLQIARIVANIIDQYDTDSYPTAISIGDGAGAAYGSAVSRICLTLTKSSPFSTCLMGQTHMRLPAQATPVPPRSTTISLTNYGTPTRSRHPRRDQRNSGFGLSRGANTRFITNQAPMESEPDTPMCIPWEAPAPNFRLRMQAMRPWCSPWMAPTAMHSRATVNRA